MQRLTIFFVTAVMVVMLSSFANADVIYLKDGGALPGTAVPGPDQDKILFKTTYGDLVIPKSLILRVDYGTFDIKGTGWKEGKQEASNPFPIRFVVSPALGMGFAGGGNLETGKTGFIFGGEAGVDVLRWLSLRLGVGTGKFGSFSAGSGGMFGSFSTEPEVRVTSVLLDILFTMRFGKTAFDIGLGPGVYFTNSTIPYTYYDAYTQTYGVSSYKTKETRGGGHGTVAYRFFLKDKVSIDLKDRFHVLGGGITWLEGATAGLSLYF